MMCQVVVEKSYREVLSPAASAAPPQTASILPQIAFATSSSIVNAVPALAAVTIFRFRNVGATKQHVPFICLGWTVQIHYCLIIRYCKTLKTFCTCLYNARESH